MRHINGHYGMKEKEKKEKNQNKLKPNMPFFFNTLGFNG